MAKKAKKTCRRPRCCNDAAIEPGRHLICPLCREEQAHTVCDDCGRNLCTSSLVVACMCLLAWPLADVGWHLLGARCATWMDVQRIFHRWACVALRDWHPMPLASVLDGLPRRSCWRAIAGVCGAKLPLIALRAVRLFAIGELGVTSAERLGVHTLSHHGAHAGVLRRVISCLTSLPQHRRLLWSTALVVPAERNPRWRTSD